MASAYPGSIDTFPADRTDDTVMEANQAADHNDYADAINKIETTLGVDPQGSFATVVERLDSGLLSASISLTSAQIKTLFSSPVEIVAAPGTGMYIKPDTWAFSMNAGGTPYVSDDFNQAIVIYSDGAPFVTASKINFLLRATEDYVAVVADPGSSGDDVGDNPIPLSQVLNQAISVGLDTADPTDGDGTMTVTLTYYVFQAA